ncbi:sulfatase [Mariniblastus fucicola]|uniref:Arylsulfatase n=1 Tax=Mariniblastus fucicola TaxID=980251 RepID=A0A5B9PI63_9BACT|nr:sulfatase [Mariniblastus fucicola]QEG24965.1 Arylsulfatase [Mariniblastus fucicola]
MYKTLITLTLVSLSHPFAHSAAIAEQPEPEHTNFVFFLVDDLGWADLGCFGSEFHETPNIDRLASTGMKFTNAYAASPVCSPTRASIMTGRHPVRVDITDWIPGSRRLPESHPRFAHVDDRDNLAVSEVTIADELGSNGYQTFFAGKWHLGDEGHLPTDQGFDINLGGIDKGSPPGGYYAPFKNRMLPDRETDEYLTERLTDESIEFMKSRRKDQPFLLYLSYYNVHTPIQPYRKRVDHFREKATSSFTEKSPPIAERDGRSRSRQDNPEYASMVAAVDVSVGQILDSLDDLGLAENTVVCFFSDNGGLCTLRNKRVGPTCNAPLRSGKGWLYEGGIRCPMIVRAPGVTAADSVCDTPVSSCDFFPTMLDLAKLPAKPELHRDGVSLIDSLNGKSAEPHSTLYWHYPHYHGSAWTPGAAVRDGDWKLIEFYEYDEVELYDLRNDIGEENNLAAKNPDRVNALRTKLQQWQKSMGARMPVEQK